MKRYLDNHIDKRSFSPLDLVLLLNSRLGLFLGKLRSKLSGPFTVTQVCQCRAVERENDKREKFKVNGKRIKEYLGAHDESKIVEECMVYEVYVIKELVSRHGAKLCTSWEATQDFLI